MAGSPFGGHVSIFLSSKLPKASLRLSTRFPVKLWIFFPPSITWHQHSLVPTWRDVHHSMLTDTWLAAAFRSTSHRTINKDLKNISFFFLIIKCKRLEIIEKKIMRLGNAVPRGASMATIGAWADDLIPRIADMDIPREVSTWSPFALPPPLWLYQLRSFCGQISYW